MSNELGEFIRAKRGNKSLREFANPNRATPNTNKINQNKKLYSFCGVSCCLLFISLA